MRRALRILAILLVSGGTGWAIETLAPGVGARHWMAVGVATAIVFGYLTLVALILKGPGRGRVLSDLSKSRRGGGRIR